MDKTNLKSLILNSQKQGFLLYGEGGLGKSTLLKETTKELLIIPNTIPIYIDVKAISFDNERPLINYICSTLCGNDASIDEFNKIINNHFEEFDNYSICFIIDGLNERFDKAYLIKDIQLLSQIKNAKIIISSRVDESENYYVFSDYKKIKTKPLTDDALRQAITGQFSLDENLDLSKIDNSLLEILRNPLFLFAFFKTYENCSIFPNIYKNRAVKKAELLNAFIEKVIDDQNAKFFYTENELIEFTIKFFIPALAFHMVKNDNFTISEDDFYALIEDASYFRKLLPKEKHSILSTFKNAEFDMLTYCTKICGLVIAEPNIAFIHQIWRDFFCAYHLVNVTKSNCFDDLEVEAGDDVKLFVGELLGEYKFEDKSDTNSEMSPLEAFMQNNVSKQKNDLKFSPTVVSNIIEIMKISRNNKITACYDNLDLRECNFINCNMKCSSLKNSQIVRECFQVSENYRNINALEYLSNGTIICSLSYNLYSIDKNNNCVCIFDEDIDGFCISKDEKQIALIEMEYDELTISICAIIQNNGSIVLQHKHTIETDIEIKLCHDIKCFEYQNDNTIILVYESDDLSIAKNKYLKIDIEKQTFYSFDPSNTTNDEKSYWISPEHTKEYKECVKNKLYDEDKDFRFFCRNGIAVWSNYENENSLFVYDTKNKKMLISEQNLPYYIRSLAISQNGDKVILIVFSDDKKYKNDIVVWDTKKAKEIKYLPSKRYHYGKILQYNNAKNALLISDKQAFCFDTINKKLIKIYNCDFPYDLSISNDGEFIFSDQLSTIDLVDIICKFYNFVPKNQMDLKAIFPRDVSTFMSPNKNTIAIVTRLADSAIVCFMYDIKKQKITKKISLKEADAFKDSDDIFDFLHTKSHNIVFMPNGRDIVYYIFNEAKIINTKSKENKTIKSFKFSDNIVSIAPNEKGDKIAICTSDHKIYIYGTRANSTKFEEIHIPLPIKIKTIGFGDASNIIVFGYQSENYNRLDYIYNFFDYYTDLFTIYNYNEKEIYTFHLLQTNIIDCDFTDAEFFGMENLEEYKTTLSQNGAIIE